MALDDFIKRQLNTPTPSIAAPSASIQTPTALPTSIVIDASSAPSSLLTSTPTTTQVQESAAASTSAAAASTNNASSGGLPMGQLLAAIITPIAFIIILIPIIYILWVRHRTRRRDSGRRQDPHPETPAPETRLLRHSPQNSTFLPSPLNDSDRIKSGSLGVFELRRSLEDQGRAGSIGVFHQQPRKAGYASSPAERGPSPTLPSPKVPVFNRPPSEAWPLPAGGIKLPSPSTLYDPHMNTNKPLPSPAAAAKASSNPSSSPAPAPQHPSVSKSRDQNPDILSYASSDVLVAPGAIWRPTSSNYDLTPSTGTFPENARSTPQQHQKTGSTATGSRRRDSDLVSELSYHEHNEGGRRRDTDAISVVSAMTNERRRRSERDADALSLVSVLSPEEPRVPMEHYPL